MMRISALGAALVALALPTHANAIVGGAPPADPAVSDSVVTIVGSRGNFCSGVMIAPDIALSAAHCVQRGAVYKIVRKGGSDPQLLNVRRIAQHPGFDVGAILRNRASADVALLQLEEPFAGRKPASIGTPSELRPGLRFTLAGAGVTRRGDGASGGTVRSAALVTTDNPGELQMRLTDPSTNNQKPGLGGCTGDSGAPVFEEQQGKAIVVGVVSWSTAARNADGCGGLTGVTPLKRYRDWIEKIARAWGAKL